MFVVQQEKGHPPAAHGVQRSSTSDDAGSDKVVQVALKDGGHAKTLSRI